MWTRLDAVLARSFAVDLRALALFRIGIAAVLLIDLFHRSRDLVAHYTDAGIYPASIALLERGRGVYGSVHWLASGSAPAEAALFVAHALLALALLLGFRTRIAAAGCWYLLASLHARNPYLATMGGDRFLRLLLFFAIFAPIGARFALDAMRVRRPPVSNRVVSVPGAALLLQIAVMYVATGLAKSGETWKDGTALTLALNLEQYATIFTPWLRDQHWMHAPLTYATRWFEILGPLLPFVPFRNALFRVAAFVAFTAFHLGLGIFLDIGPFPIMCIPAWFAFLPSELFDRWLPALGARFAPSPAGAAPLRTPLWTQVAAGTALAYVLFANAALTIGWEIPKPVSAFGTALRLTQTWRMFAPDPTRQDVWLVVDGRLADGRTVDPWRGAEVSFAKPADIRAIVPGFRWRLYTWYGLILFPELPGQRERHILLANYLCRTWNEDHSGASRLVHLRTIGLVEVTGDPPEKPPQRVPIAQLDCPEDGTPARRGETSR